MNRRFHNAHKAEDMLLESGHYCYVTLERVDNGSISAMFLPAKGITDYAKYVEENFPEYRYIMRTVKVPMIDGTRSHYTLMFS